MLETEIRATVATEEGDIADRLLELGYESNGRVMQVDHIFDLPGAPRFLSGEKLRLRHEGDRAEITFKSNMSASTAVSRRDEATVQLEGQQLNECVTLMGALGYQLIFSLPKQRTTYVRGAVQVTLDQVPIIGLLIEIEGPEGEIQAAAHALAPDAEFRNYRLKELTEQSLAASGLGFEEAQRRAEREWNMPFGDLAVALGMGRSN